jgi:Protein of unknown function (DUF995)
MKASSHLNCFVFSAAIVLTTCTSMALADKLPKGAIPLTAEELTAIYADHSGDWKPSNKAYFGADGSVKGFFDAYYFSGKWQVTGNKICMGNQPTNSKTKQLDAKIYTDCWEWTKLGKDYWVFYSNDYEKKKFNRADGWSKNEFKQLKKGDLATAKYMALGGK